MSQPSSGAARPAIGRVRTDQDHADLLTYHLSQIRTAEADVETARGPVKAAKAVLTDAQEDLTKRFNAAMADLGRGYTREYLSSLIEDGRQKITPLVDFEKMRARDKVALSQPVYGVQPELFPGEETPSAARDEMAWEAEGYLRGLRGELEEIQQGDPPAFHQAIMRGYEKGQGETQERVARAMLLKQREGEPDGAQQAVDLNAADALDPDHIEDEADKLKRSGFMDTSAAGDAGADGFEATEDELAQQSTRQAVKDSRADDAANDQSAAA